MRKIFTMGGGGFTMEPSNPALDDYVLSLAGEPEPRILFLPTASGDPALQIAAFHDRFNGRACHPEALSLFRLHGTTRSIFDVLRDQDIVYVGGGSMRNLLAIWRAHGLDEALVEAWKRGVVLCGLSAGAMCWFEGGITKSGGPPEPIDGLGLLPGSFSVHADGEPERLPVWLDAVKTGRLPGGWAADDGVGLLWRDRMVERIVASRPGSTALRVDALGGELVRRRDTPHLLAAATPRRYTVPDDVRELRAVNQLRARAGRRR